MKAEHSAIIHSMLLALRPGEKLNSDQLAIGCGVRHQKSYDRRIREAVCQLRSRGIWALGDDFGYWISTDIEEVRRYCAEARRDARKAYKTRMISIIAMERACNAFLRGPGQQIELSMG